MGNDKHRLVRLGALIRFYRQREGASLDQLAARAGLSKGFLSDVENGKSAMSLKNFYRVVDSLGITAPQLLTEAEEQVVIKSNALEFSEIVEGVELTSLSSRARAELEPLLFRVGIGGRVQPHERASSEEFIYVIDGRITLCYGEKEYELNTGDAAHFDPLVDHYAVNTSDAEARYIVVHLRDETPGQIVTRSQSVEPSHVAPGAQSVPLSSMKNIRLQPTLLTLGVGADTQAYQHAWSEEFVYLIHGRMKLNYGREEYELSPEDAAHFVTYIDHYMENISDAEACCLVIRLPR